MSQSPAIRNYYLVAKDQRQKPYIRVFQYAATAPRMICLQLSASQLPSDHTLIWDGFTRADADAALREYQEDHG